MATLDVSAWIKYRQDGGRLSLSEWIAAGRPKGSPQPPSNPFTSNKPIPLSGNPLAPGLPHAAPSAIEDTIDQDLTDAERQAQEGDNTPPEEDDFTNPTKLPSTPPPVGFKWDWDGFRWQPKAVEEESTVDPELSNPRQMPSTSPPPNHHWEWKGSQWQPVKDEATTEKGTPKGGYATPEEAEKARQDSGNPDWYTVETAAGTNGVYYYLSQSSTYGKKKKEKDYNYVGQTYVDTNGKGWRWDDYEGYVRDTSLDKDEGSFESDDEKRAREEREKERQAQASQDDADRERQRQRDEEDKRRFEIEQKRQSEDIAFRQQQATQTSDQFWKQFDYQKQQDAARMQAEKEARLANLRASPASWLQYSLEANQTPVIQPWQKPLMPQQYGNLNVGQPIPGWQGLNQGSANLPELTTPSTQYFARIGPTAQQQWGGYQQMQSGAPIEESMFRLQSQSAPGGRNQGLSWLR